MLRAHEIRSIFYSKYILHAMLSKTKDWRATENNSNIPNDTSCNNSQIFYSCECKWYLYSRSYELKTIAKNCISEKNEPARQCWDEFNKFNSKQKKLFDWNIYRKAYIISRFWITWTKFLTCFLHYEVLVNPFLANTVFILYLCKRGFSDVSNQLSLWY